MRNKSTYICFVCLLALICIYYMFISGDKAILTPPNFRHWFGTDLNGNDVFIKVSVAVFMELFTVGVIVLIVWFLGLILGSLTLYSNQSTIKDFILNFIHFIASLPILLVALFLLILFGPGYPNSIIILSLAIVPTQALFVYNIIDNARQEEFLLAKKSYGISNRNIIRKHLIPFISQKYKSYTMSRIPEILMMNIALGFLGLNMLEPYPASGKLLFDGLSFMFSAWWLWVFIVIEIVGVFYFVIKYISNTYGYYL